MYFGYFNAAWREQIARIYWDAQKKRFLLNRKIVFSLQKYFIAYQTRRGDIIMFKLDGIKDTDKIFELWTKELEKELSGFWNDFLK